ncbi:PREDICTED: ommochrome-binding protein-like [Papilio xuthus]|uniref:Ommochrome-binding protein n=1 Tax=Papilio xuthus TaxID=66420 RepID=A0A194Q2I5_PAPXU|nr:PREDICTED: ommochrome-binding protein-like [Papilio xuthus]KPI99756.1 Ommochrome-binding protein [Papilio xuthus]
MDKNLLLSFMIFTTVECSKNLGKVCDLVTDDLLKQCYIRETLVSISHSPNQLAVNKNTNTVYFSFDSGQGEYIPAAVQIESKKVTVLKGVKDAFAVTNDPLIGEMYFGGSNGIYKYNPAQQTLKRLAVKNLDIWWLFFKKIIYFIRFPSLNAYCYHDRLVKPVTPLMNVTVNQFVFDNDDNIFFINGTGLFGIKNGQSDIILLRDSPRFLGMAANNKGHVYLCSENEIFVISKMIQKVKKIVNIPGVLGMTFDKDNNLIYSDSHEIVRLLPISNSYLKL